MKSEKRIRPYAFAIVIISQLFALMTHGYLTIRHYKLKMGIPAEDDFCRMGESFNCDAVSASIYSEIFGLPLALWGWATNFILLLMIITYGRSKNKAFGHHIFYLSLFVFLMSLIMAGISKFVLGQYCLYCMAAYILSFVTLIALVGITPIPAWHSLGQDIQAIFKSTRQTLVAIIFVPVVAFIGHTVFQEVYSDKEILKTINQLVEMWENNKKYDLPKEGALVMGPSAENATMTLTEFAEFRCGHCKNAIQPVKTFVKSHPDVRYEFMLFPLDGACNPHISHATGISCKLAKATYCANEKNKGWALHDLIFKNQRKFDSLSSTDALLKKIALETGLNAQELLQCAESDKYDSLIKKHADAAQAAGVQGTPAFFVNGKSLRGGQALPILQKVYKKMKQ